MNEENKGTNHENITMQNVVQEMLPDDLKKKFVLQKNSGDLTGAGGGQSPSAQNPFGSTPTAVPLDPNLVQKPIRTYESDLAEALAKNKGSVASISIAESRRKEAESRKQEGSVTNTPPPTAQQKIYSGPQAVRPTATTAIPGARIDIAPQAPPPEAVPDSYVAPFPHSPSNSGSVPASAPVEIPASVPKEVPVSAQMEVPVRPPEPPPMPRPTPQVVPAAVYVPPQVQTAPVVPETLEVPKRSFIKPLVLTLLSLFFISGGVVAGYLVYKQSSWGQPAEPIKEAIIIPSLIPHDKRVAIPIGGSIGNQLITKMYAELNKNPAASGKIIELVISETTGEAETVQMTGSSFMQKIGTRMPDVILRSLTDRWMFGVYGEEDGNKTSFIALTTDFFQNAFAGMLIWEDIMPDDLALLLNFKDRARRDELNSTSSISSYFSIRGEWSDKVVRNRDVRQFISPQGELLFLYSFINKETFIITTTESAFLSLIDRIEKETYVR